jgi:hypothetical protein
MYGHDQHCDLHAAKNSKQSFTTRPPRLSPAHHQAALGEQRGNLRHVDKRLVRLVQVPAQVLSAARSNFRSPFSAYSSTSARASVSGTNATSNAACSAATMLPAARAR